MRSPDQVEGWHKAGILVLNSSLRNSSLRNFSLGNSKTRGSGGKNKAPRFFSYFLCSQRSTSRGAVSTAVAGEISRLNFKRVAQKTAVKVSPEQAGLCEL